MRTWRDLQLMKCDLLEEGEGNERKFTVITRVAELVRGGRRK